MIRKIEFIILIFTLLFLVPFSTSSQCVGFSKKHCLPLLDPYYYDGQLNFISMSQGDKAHLILTLYSGQDYRLMVCGQPILKDLRYRLLDTFSNEIYDSKNNNLSSYWDFSVTSTQRFILEVEVPETSQKTMFMETGCVSVLLGFKLD